MHAFYLLMLWLPCVSGSATAETKPIKSASAQGVVLQATKTAVRVQRVFGPEHPGGRYKHPASITQLANGRTPLTAALSTDGAKTYPYRLNLVEGPGDYAYPYAIQTKDNEIHLVFTSDERTTIYHAVFEEADLLRGQPETSK